MSILYLERLYWNRVLVALLAAQLRLYNYRPPSFNQASLHTNLQSESATTVNELAFINLTYIITSWIWTRQIVFVKRHALISKSNNFSSHNVHHLWNIYTEENTMVQFRDISEILNAPHPAKTGSLQVDIRANLCCQENYFRLTNH